MNNRVLYLTNCYAPPDQVSAGPSSRHYYHVNSLVQKGFHIEIITSDQSTVSSKQLEFHKSGSNPKIQSVSLNAISQNNLLSQMAYHVTFFFKTLVKALRTSKVDIVVASIPSLLIGCIAYVVSRNHKAKLVLDVRDLWSDSLSTTSLAKIPLFLKINQWIEKTLYSKANIICCTSQAQVKTVKYLTKEKVSVWFIPNGVDPEIIKNKTIHPFILDIRKKYRWIGLFAGKHSKYTDLDNLIDAAKELVRDNFAFILVGGGYTKSRLIDRVQKEGIINVFFHDPVPKTEIASFEAGADIFLINYSPEKAWAKVLPNKLFDYMYWNKPIIAAVVQGEITRILHENRLGLGIKPGNPQALIKAIRLFTRNNLSFANTRTYLLQNFDRKNTVKKFACMIETQKKK